jgi:hypothetical protein
LNTFRERGGEGCPPKSRLSWSIREAASRPFDGYPFTVFLEKIAFDYFPLIDKRDKDDRIIRQFADITLPDVHFCGTGIIIRLQHLYRRHVFATSFSLFTSKNIQIYFQALLGMGEQVARLGERDQNVMHFSGMLD